jgi:hypothetical protein
MKTVCFRALMVALALVPVLSAQRGRAASCDPIQTFADSKLPSREVFVSPAGDNSTGDGSQAKPYQTISRAVQGIQPGDAIRLLPGTHAAGTFLSNLTGTSNAPIWLGGVPGQVRPVISGGSTALQLSRIRYVVVENLEVSGTTANGLNCDDGGDYANSNAARHVLFRNLYIHDIGTGGNQDGLKLSGLYDYAVLDCEFARLSPGGSGIDHVGCHRRLIARCVVGDACHTWDGRRHGVPTAQVEQWRSGGSRQAGVVAVRWKPTAAGRDTASGGGRWTVLPGPA